MGRLQSLLSAVGGQATLRDRLGAWRSAVSHSIDGQSPVIFYPQIRFGAVVPALVEVGPTVGWLLPVGGLLYVEFPLVSGLDRSRAIEFEIAWAPTAAVAGTTVSWHLDLGAEFPGHDVTLVTSTLDAANEPVPAVTAEYAETEILIPPAAFADPRVNEFHVKVTRVASLNDQLLYGLHHVKVSQWVN